MEPRVMTQILNPSTQEAETSAELESNLSYKMRLSWGRGEVMM